MQWHELIDLAQESWITRDLVASELRLFEALKLLEGVGANNDRRILSTLELLTELLIKQGKVKQAEPYLYRLLDAQLRLTGVAKLSLAKTLQRLGEIAFFKADYSKAINFGFRSLAVLVEELGSNRLEVAEASHKLAQYYQASGNSYQADVYYKKSVASFAQAKDGDCRDARILFQSYATFLQTVQPECEVVDGAIIYGTGFVSPAMVI